MPGGCCSAGRVLRQCCWGQHAVAVASWAPTCTSWHEAAKPALPAPATRRGRAACTGCPLRAGWLTAPPPAYTSLPPPPPSPRTQMVGVGYKAAVAGSKLTLNLGYSHPIDMEVPKGIEVRCWYLRGWLALQRGWQPWLIALGAGGRGCWRSLRAQAQVAHPTPPHTAPPLAPHTRAGQGGAQHDGRGGRLRQGAGRPVCGQHPQLARAGAVQGQGHQVSHL